MRASASCNIFSLGTPACPDCLSLDGVLDTPLLSSFYGWVRSSSMKTSAQAGDEVLVSASQVLLDCSEAVQCCWTIIAARINDSIGWQKAARFF